VRDQLQQNGTPAATSPASTSPGTQTVASSVYEKVGSAVVHIVVTSASGRSSGNGSGVVIDASGHILTNNHVISGARSISVRFASGETRTAQVIGTDSANDLALLKVDLPQGVTPAALGDSDAVVVGEIAVAIGSPFGLSETVTQGIVSAVDRTFQTRNGPARQGLIQTDAPINPGNSGGPLLNARGEVIGINSLIESPVEGSVGIGFAVPINVAKQLMPQLQAGANLEPAWLGVSGVTVDPTMARDLGLTVSAGVLLASVVAGSPAARAGLRGGTETGATVPSGGDVVTAIDGKAVASMNDLASRIAGKKPGDSVELTVVRGGQPLRVNVTLDKWPTTTG
jgi:putative serine protease PepD